MKVFGTSDIHLDINSLGLHRTRVIHNPLGGNPLIAQYPNDTLLIAGDMFEVRSLIGDEPLDGFQTRIKTTVLREFELICEAYKYVVVIFGNHEFYNNAIDRAHDEFAKATSHITNLIKLDNGSVTLDGEVTIYGTTLWTDMNNADAMVQQACRRGMNDYHLILNEGGALNEYGEFRRLLPADTIDLYTRNREWLMTELANIDPDGTVPIIVMTHHAPILGHVNNQRSGFSPVNFAYAATNLEYPILENDEKVAVWFHGHTHDHKTTEVGKTVVVTAARGYYEEAFEPVLLLDTEVVHVNE